jgi:hypothetical protein
MKKPGCLFSNPLKRDAVCDTVMFCFIIFSKIRGKSTTKFRFDSFFDRIFPGNPNRVSNPGSGSDS